MSLLKKGIIECMGIALIILISSGFFEFLRDYFPSYQMIAPFVTAVLMFTLVFVFYQTTGAHFNPIITVAVYLSNLFKPKDSKEFGHKELGVYLLAQFIGAILGIVANIIIFGHDCIGLVEPTAQFEVLSNHNIKGFFIEVLLSLIFVFSYLVIARFKYKYLSKAIIIASITLVILIVGNFTTKTSVNPFRALVSVVIDFLYLRGDTQKLTDLWIYVIGPFIGSIIGYGLYKGLSHIPKSKRSEVNKLAFYAANINLNAMFYETSVAKQESITSTPIPLIKEIDNEIKVDETLPLNKETTLARANQTFEERIRNLDHDLYKKYQDLRSYCLQYGLKEKMDQVYNVFSLNKTRYIVFSIRGKALKIYFALDPKDYEDSKIAFQDGSNITKYKDVPLILKVKSDLSYKRAITLIDDTMERANINLKN